MSVLHYLLISLIYLTAAQFPSHVDFKKVGLVTFNNQKYKVLKPTVHKITDHFKDFVLRRGNKKKNEKVFIDDNGFRHFWGGLETKDKSLRKTEISLYEVNNEKTDKDKAMANEDANDKNEVDNINLKAEENTTNVVRKKPKRPKTSEELNEEEEAEKAMLRAMTTKKPVSGGGGGGKKVAMTSFFCPFFGVITMTSFID